MALTNEQRDRCVGEMVRQAPPVVPSKTDLHAAIAAADQWCADNAASFNNALPQPARGLLTNAQKAALLASVALRRFGL